MIFNALTAAAMLLGANFMPVSELRVNVEPTPVVMNFVDAMQLTSTTRKRLIEQHAAPHWGLSIAQAWSLYENGTLTIHEIVPEVQYIIEYEGILEILLSGED